MTVKILQPRARVELSDPLRTSVASVPLKSSRAALLCLSNGLFPVKSEQIMKAPKIMFVVISTIGLASIVGIFVFAQSPAPSTNGQDLPFHLVMVCAKVDKAKLMAALKARPKDTYRIQYDTDAPVGTLPIPTPSPCSADKFNGKSTQKATFENTTELHAFLTAAGL
jgi:hypothetical protein